MLGHAVHHVKDTTHKTLKTIGNAHVWPTQCYKSCANGYNIVLLCFGDRRTKKTCWELLAQKFDQFLELYRTTPNDMQQHATGCANRHKM